MKTLRQMKKRTLMTVLFLGVSLAAFAFPPLVRIIWWTLTDITSSSAHLVVHSQGAESLTVEIRNLDDEILDIKSFATGATSSMEETFYPMDLINLKPDTQYKIVVTANGFFDQSNQRNYDSRIIYFTTEPDIQP